MMVLNEIGIGTGLHMYEKYQDFPRVDEELTVGKYSIIERNMIGEEFSSVMEIEETTFKSTSNNKKTKYHCYMSKLLPYVWGQ